MKTDEIREENVKHGIGVICKVVAIVGIVVFSNFGYEALFYKKKIITTTLSAVRLKRREKERDK